ncbi:putative disease resistance protein At1g63350 [Ziziphus jujuba]|uniref:Disease resistance protein At1g63350 n=1 Tax=Ziziphus jujuba TaxID=326968 RepID=A0ABM3ZTW2_ZIZJJ|nr:putative disease resistance protein At1g63350 [Ziziphus jujuba]
MDALRNANARMVGVYGMAGIGKTMLAKEVARQAKEEKLFNKTESISVRAERCLSRRLGQETEILRVLDDVWDKFELHEVGIAFENDRNQCKILFTSRSREVVCNDMGADKIFMLEVLSYNEAKDLFGKIVGDSMMNNPDIQPLATVIVEECGGSRIAITTVANAWKSKSYPTWDNTLQELRRSAPTNIKGMHDIVYSSITVSYNLLESDEAKLMLLFIGLYLEDCHIRSLTFLIYGIGLGLFQGIKGLEEAENRVLIEVENLKPFRNYVPELEDSRQLEDATAISLLYSTDDFRLPERLQCPQLKFLFEEMKDLRVLRVVYSVFINSAFVVSIPSKSSKSWLLEVIERNVISSLTHLGNLSLEHCFTKWDTEGGNRYRRDANLIELKNLSRLSYLRIDMPDVNVMPKDLFSTKLKSYRIIIGRFRTHSNGMSIMSGAYCSKVLGLELDIRRLRGDHGLQMSLKRSQPLNLYTSNG